jgi:hypothetical protein
MAYNMHPWIGDWEDHRAHFYIMMKGKEHVRFEVLMAVKT